MPCISSIHMLVLITSAVLMVFSSQREALYIYPTHKLKQQVELLTCKLPVPNPISINSPAHRRPEYHSQEQSRGCYLATVTKVLL